MRWRIYFRRLPFQVSGMNILAFDTCLGAVSVAVRRRGAGGEWLMRHACETRERGHAERLMPMVAETMAAAGLAFSDLDRIAVTVGPGSFTGVRVGVAAARGLALASGIAVVGATSLAVMAHRADERLGPSATAACWRWPSMPAAAGVPSAFHWRERCRWAASATGRRCGPQHRDPARGHRRLGGAVGGRRPGRRWEAEAALVDLQPDARSLAMLRPLLAAEPRQATVAAPLSAAARRQAPGRPLPWREPP